MKPRPRVKLNGVSSKNQSLQDILITSNIADEVISVDVKNSGIHNTKLTLLKPDGEQRVHFYNRLDLAKILADVAVEATTIDEIISELNIKGYDFNEDDLEIIDNSITAKITSLGYVGQYRLTQVTPPIKGGWGFNYGSDFGATMT